MVRSSSYVKILVMGISLSNWIFASEWEVLAICFLLGLGGTILGFYLSAKKQKTKFEFLRPIEIGITLVAILFIEAQAIGAWFSNGEAASLVGWVIFNVMGFVACLFALPAAIFTPKGRGVLVKVAGLIWVVAVSGIAIYFSHWALFSNSPSAQQLGPATVVIEPVAENTYVEGSAYKISWGGSSVSSHQSVTLELYQGSACGIYHGIQICGTRVGSADMYFSDDNVGYYEWQVPKNIVPGSNYSIVLSFAGISVAQSVPFNVQE